MISFLRKYSFRIAGVLVLALSIVSVLYTASYNRRQSELVRCGTLVVGQIIHALHARDSASAAYAVIDKRTVEARYALLLTLAGAPDAPNISRTQLLQNYEKTVHDREAATDAYVLALQNAPLPDPQCLGPP